MINKIGRGYWPEPFRPIIPYWPEWFRPIIPYWTEPFRPIIPYWPELFRSIIPYWPELFRPIIPYWPELLRPIPANKLLLAQQNQKSYGIFGFFSGEYNWPVFPGHQSSSLIQFRFFFFFGGGGQLSFTKVVVKTIQSACTAKWALGLLEAVSQPFLRSEKASSLEEGGGLSSICQNIKVFLHLLKIEVIFNFGKNNGVLPAFKSQGSSLNVNVNPLSRRRGTG